MNCPICAHGEHRVLRSRTNDRGAIVRMRECLQCGKRWRTVEMDEARAEKADEVLEAFRAIQGMVRGE